MVLAKSQDLVFGMRYGGINGQTSKNTLPNKKYLNSFEFQQNINRAHSFYCEMKHSFHLTRHNTYTFSLLPKREASTYI